MFGVSASSFTANMVIKQLATSEQDCFPTAASVIQTSFYVDDRLTGASSISEAVDLQKQLQELFE